MTKTQRVNKGYYEIFNDSYVMIGKVVRGEDGSWLAITNDDKQLSERRQTIQGERVFFSFANRADAMAAIELNALKFPGKVTVYMVESLEDSADEDAFSRYSYDSLWFKHEDAEAKAKTLYGGRVVTTEIK